MNKILVSAGIILSLGLASVASAQTTCVNLSGTLAYGSRSAQVTTLQNFLVSRNYPGGGNWMITGYFGSATQAAVKLFQQENGLPQTGMVDSATASAINSASCGYTSPINPINPISPVNPWSPTYPYNPYNPYTPYGTAPVITSLSQNTGSAGNTVTVYGSGFDAYNNTVNFGSQPIYNIPSSNGTSLTFTIPSYYSGASYSFVGSSVQLSVVSSRGTSNSVTFTLYGGYNYGCGTYPYGTYPYNSNCGCNYGYGYNNCQPSNPSTLSLSYLQPYSGAVGTSVTVYGSGFTPTGNSVHFGAGVIANLMSPDGRSVSFVVPANLTGYGSQPVTVGTYAVSAVNGIGVSSNSLTFNVTSVSSNAAPVINSVTGPTSLQTSAQGTWSLSMTNPANSYATVSVNWGDSGNGFVNMAAPQTVYQTGTQTLTFTHAYNTAGNYTIVFTVANQSGQSTTYSATISVSGSGYVGNTSISSINPTIARVGQQIAIQGTGFSLYGNTVHFGVGGQQNVPSYNGTTIYYTIPSAVTPCDVNQYFTVCPAYAQQVTPGSYQLYVTNQNGTTNTVTVTVTQ